MSTLRERLRLPETILGFPVEMPAESTSNPSSRVRRVRERGIALLMAVMIIGLMMIFASDMIVTSSVELAMAVRNRDNVKAEFIAKSAANLATFTLAADLAKDLFLAGPQSPMPSKPGEASVKFWDSLNALPPIGGQSKEALAVVAEGLGLSSVLDSGVLDQMQLFEGDMKINVADERARINVNYCSSGAREPCTVVKLMLNALLSCPAERLFLEKRKVTPEQLAARIQDYVDSDSRADPDSGFNDENDPYQRRANQMRAKNAPLDTLDELRVVDGWDDDVHAVFSRYLTAYPFWRKREERPRINLTSSSREMLQCIFPEARGEGAEKLALALRARDADGEPIFQPGQKMSDILRGLVGYSTGSGQPNDPNDKATWFSKWSNVYRVSTESTVGGSTKRLEMVVERVMPEPAKGQTSSHRILYYKML